MLSDAPDVANVPGWMSGETFIVEEPCDDVEVTIPDDPATRYEVLGPLGRGGSGDVLLAVDRHIGRKVAIKRVRHSSAGRPRARFLREIRALGQLEHPNIAPIYDVGSDDQGDWFVMRLVEGQTLEQILDRLRRGDPEAHQRFGFAARAQIGIALLNAVAHAHARGLIHRDLKPANVMVGDHGDVQLIDWGLATGADLPAERGIAGSPAYMSPEQAAGHAIDERSDVYGIGVLLHELFTLQHYLAGADSLEDLLEGAKTRPVPFAARMRHEHQDPVPAEFAWVVERATRANPDDRFASACEFAEALQSALEGEFDGRCPITLQKFVLRKLLKLSDRHPFALPAAAASHAAILGALATYALMS